MNNRCALVGTSISLSLDSGSATLTSFATTLKMIFTDLLFGVQQQHYGGGRNMIQFTSNDLNMSLR